MDSGDAAPLRSRPARRLAGPRLRCSKRIRQDLRQTKTSDTQTVGKTWRKMATVSVGRGLVFLARAGCARENKSVQLRDTRITPALISSAPRVNRSVSLSLS